MEDCENEKLKWEPQARRANHKTHGNTGKNIFDTNSRRLINVALFVSFRATKDYKVSVATKTCFQLPN